MTFQRILLARRRIDAAALAVVFAALAVMASPAKILLVFFAGAGAYLTLLRPRSWAHFPPAFSVAVLAYATWAIGLSLLRGEGIEGNRQIGYVAIQVASLLLPLGLCLVARPMDAMAIGSRIGLLVVSLLVFLEFLSGSLRIGLGENPAILAFMIASTALLARLPAAKAPRLLPNGRWWTYIALLPVVLTLTRAGALVFVVVVLFDLLAIVRGRAARGLPRGIIALAGVAVVVGAVVAAPVVSERVSVGVEEMQSFLQSGDASGSIDIRLAMISSGLSVLAEHPLIGVGSMVRVERVAAMAGENAETILLYEHLHNFVLDEALSNGLVGLALLLLVFVAFLVTVYRTTANGLVREVAILLVCLVFSYGMFHGVLLNEWMIVAIYAPMAIILAHLRSRRVPGGQRDVRDPERTARSR